MVSIILPIYQVEEYIEQCLESLLSQTYKDIEIICVNDCTMDNSITIVKDYQKRDPRIHIINHENNRGLGGARNTGIQFAHGEYIMFVDTDDYVDISMVEHLYTSIIKSSSDASVCGIMLVNDSAQTVSPHKGFHYEILSEEKVYDLQNDKAILTDMWPSAWNKLWKRSIILKNQIRFKERILYEDHTFFYEYFSKCNSFSYIDKPLYYYRNKRPKSITTQSVGREKEIFIILEYISEIFKSIYSDNTYLELYLKIVVRLVYERRWVFDPVDKNYYIYLHEVCDYLSIWKKELLFKYKDSFIDKTDPIFYNAAEIDEYEKKNSGKWGYNKLNNFLKRIKKLPTLDRTSKDSKYLKFEKDFYWYAHNTYNSVQKIENKIGEISNQNIEQVINHSNVRNESILSSYFEKMQNGQNDIIEAQKSLVQNIAQEHVEERLSDIELSFNTYKKKLDDIWWLSWNIKDHMDKNNIEKNSSERNYYPTWIPGEFPQYFQGNVWYWSDKFKDYYFSHYDSYNQEFENLFRHLPEDDIRYLKILWERNTRMIPYSEYVEKEGFLINKNVFFTEIELIEQDKIVRSFNEITQPYILPDKIVYEIPVFYYEHGLKMMSEKNSDYIRQGDILDLGAYIGDSAIILSKYTNRKIYSVEMNQNNIKIMKSVLSSNHVSQKIEIICGAVGDKDSTQIFYGDESYSTLNEMGQENLYQKSNEVSVYKVDTLTAQYNIQPHFIKIDVEGMEYKTILGAQETIYKYRPILCISIYHTPIDFLRIKPLIESWNLGYNFHIENHNPFDPVYEKMLIAIPADI